MGVSCLLAHVFPASGVLVDLAKTFENLLVIGSWICFVQDFHTSSLDKQRATSGDWMFSLFNMFIFLKDQQFFFIAGTTGQSCASLVHRKCSNGHSVEIKLRNQMWLGHQMVGSGLSDFPAKNPKKKVLLFTVHCDIAGVNSLLVGSSRGFF